MKDFLKLVLYALIHEKKPIGIQKEFLKAFISNGYESLSLILFASATAGHLITEELSIQMHKALHAVQMVPGVSGQFIFRELGVILPAMLLSAKAGASITAEIGSMKVTEQIDALRILGINPIVHLVIPRLLAGILSNLCLSIISIFLSLSMAIWTAVIHYNFSILEYITHLSHFLGLKDIILMLVKASMYGAVIPLLACYHGLNCKFGAQAVGNATTDSVVYSMLSIIVLDFIITYFFALIIS